MIIDRDKYKSGRLTAKIGNTTPKGKIPTGLQALNLTKVKDGLIYIPGSYDTSQPAALAVMLHGAGAPAEQGISLLQQYADENNMILIAPASRAYSWDIIASRAFGPDVIGIDRALSQAFENYIIDPARIAVGGFSDGASYALSMGLTNGDLFTHVIAFSPGFAHTLEKRGKPAVFVSHGVDDPVLPIDSCSRRIVPQLQRQGLEVNYLEFEGGHEIPSFVSAGAVDWFLEKSEK